MMFGRKKEEVHKGDIYLAKGIYLKTPVMDNGNLLMNSFLRCFVVFALAFGSLGGVLSSFHISYNFPLVVVAYLILAMYFSLLYSTTKLIFRDVGYILFFVVFVTAIMQLKTYANSGLYTIVNAVLQQAQSFFDLSGITQYDVSVDNDFVTVSIFMIFAGMVLIILLNIWLSTSMSVIWSVGLTFPFFLLPLYFKQVPDALCMILLCSGYIAVLVFKANGHFVTYGANQAFRIRGLKKDRVVYTQDSSVFRQVLLSVMTILLCMVMIVETVFPNNAFQSRFKENKLWDDTGDVVSNFLLLGFRGLYNRYSSTGGMSGGKLGGVSSVRPDYRTDLNVFFAPYSNEPIYLKGYTGGVYGDNEWISIYDERGDAVDKTDTRIFIDESMKEEAMGLQMASIRGEEYSARGTMRVYNEGADPHYLYYPYYTIFDDYASFHRNRVEQIPNGLQYHQVEEYKFCPKQIWEEELLSQRPGDMDVSLVNSIYLDVPEKNQTVIGEECEKIGLTKKMSIEEVTNGVKEYFEENIPYTLKPGATPRDEDFINFFLTKNRKGYCAHFASAATLIFRQCGIPARYVEGYAFSFETVLASDAVDWGVYEDFFEGYSSIGKSAVMNVEVTDAMAHAWVEIYIDGFGWRPVEVTPGSNEVVDEDDFWTAFGKMMNNVNLDIGAEDGNNMGMIDIMKYRWFIFSIMMILAVIVILFMIRIVIRKMMRFARLHQKDKAQALICQYANVCDMIRTCTDEFASCNSHREQLQYINRCYLSLDDIDGICSFLEQLSYGKDTVTDEVIISLMQIVKRIRKAIWKKAGLSQKTRLIRR